MFASLDDQNGRSDFEVKVFPECNAQHDEVEPILEKILHRSYCHAVSPANLKKKSDSVAPVRKITEPCFQIEITE